MRTINIPDKVYAQLQELLKEVQTWQLVRHGRLIAETPEDVIPWLIGYYKSEHERVKIFSLVRDDLCPRYATTTSAEKVLDIIRKVDSCCCPHKECHSGEGHDGLNCRDCLIKWIEEELREARR